MIASKLAEAKGAVEVRLQYAPHMAQATVNWMIEMLNKTSDQDVAVELGLWWDSHPANPNSLLG